MLQNHNPNHSIPWSWYMLHNHNHLLPWCWYMLHNHNHSLHWCCYMLHNYNHSLIWCAYMLYNHNNSIPWSCYMLKNHNHSLTSGSAPFSNTSRYYNLQFCNSPLIHPFIKNPFYYKTPTLQITFITIPLYYKFPLWPRPVLTTPFVQLTVSPFVQPKVRKPYLVTFFLCEKSIWWNKNVEWKKKLFVKFFCLVF